LLRPLYRTRQVWLALRPRIDASELASARAELSPGLLCLFDAMESRDKRHALEVRRRLLYAGIDDREVLVAALLHDCGKGAVPVWLRVVKVLLPGLLRSMAHRCDPDRRGAAYRLVHHTEIGAEAVAAAGASSLTVALIRGEVAPADRPHLAQLTAADDAS
jgi:hypothetical protein